MNDKTSIKKDLAGVLIRLAFSVGFVALLSWFFALQSCSSGHPGPNRIVSLGVVRFTECKYKGDFVGGAGFLCTAKNVSTDEPRDVENMRCGGYDESNRIVGSPSNVYDLDRQVIAPGEERIITVYGPDESSTLVCSETGDLFSPAQMTSTALQQLQAKNLITDISI